MNILRISINNVLSKPLSALLTVLMLTMGVALVSILFHAGSAIDEGFRKNIQGIDMVAGAKGSPLQLILSAIYHIDNPTGNISRKEVQKLRQNRLVKSTIELAYGDSYKGRRIVGTSHAYPALYGMELEEGALWNSTFEATIGAQVAEEFGLGVGDTFYIAHGADADAEVHGDFPFTVVGIFKPSGTAVDRLLLTSLQSIWDVHPIPGDSLGEQQEVTAVLVQFKNKMGILSVPRWVNKETSMQAALPAIEVNRLFDLFGLGLSVMRIVAAVIMVLGAISIFVSMLNTLKERAEEMAIIRAMGAGREQVFGMVLFEGIFLGILGFFSGILLAHVSLLLFKEQAAMTYGITLAPFQFMSMELWLLMIVLFICGMAAMIPAIFTIRMDISKILSRYAR